MMVGRQVREERIHGEVRADDRCLLDCQDEGIGERRKSTGQT